MIDYISEVYPDLVVVDGFDDCIIGVMNSINETEKVAYSTQKMLDKLVSRGMDHTEALEFYEYNIAGSYVGEHTPVFIDEGIH